MTVPVLYEGSPVSQVIAVVIIMFRFVQKAVQIFFHSDISIQGFTCAPRIGDEVMPIGSKIR